MDMVTNQEYFLKPAEVARRLNISVSQLHRMLNRGDLACVRMGPQTVRVRSVDLESYISAQLQKSGRPVN